MAEPAVRMTGLTKRYGDVVAVDSLDLAVEAGQVHGLLGPNGAGKTTALRMLLGLVEPDQGAVSVHGRSVHPRPHRALAKVGGFVEAPRFAPHLSVCQTLRSLGRLDGLTGAIAAARIDHVLEVVDLRDHDGVRVRELSLGMVQRLGIAAALLRAPDVLVLDEPTNALDPSGIRDVRALVRGLAEQGVAVLLSSHDMTEVEETCSRVSILSRGSMAFDGSLAELRERAGTTQRHVVTSENTRAIKVAASVPGVSGIRHCGDGIVLTADDDTVEDLARALVEAGIGIRSVQATRSAVESLFFRLTDADGSTGAAA